MTSRRTVRIAFSVAIGTCFVGNIFAAYYLDHFDFSSERTVYEVYSAAVNGLIFGEATLLAIWCVLSAEPLFIRFPRALALSVLVFYSLLIGMQMAGSAMEIGGFIFSSVLTMFVFSVLTVPLWFARRLSRRRIVSQGQVDVQREQFTMRHILIWTAVVAAMTGLGKLIIQPDFSLDGMQLPPAAHWTFLVLAALVSLFVAMLGLPLVWGLLAKRPSCRALGVALAILCFMPPLWNEVTAAGHPFDDRVVGIIAGYIFAAAAMTTTGAGLMLARILGFRFIPNYSSDTD